MVFKLPGSAKDIYPKNRDAAFAGILEKVSGAVAFGGSDFAVASGDCIDILSDIPDQSVDLVLTDPPYHSTKKANIYGDADFLDNTEYLDWIDALAAEWQRVLRPNGSLYLFCSSEMAPFIYVRLAARWNMHSIITWTKPNEPGYDGWKQKMKKTALRRWYPHSERIIFASPAVETNLKRSPLGNFLKNVRLQCDLTSKQLTEAAGAYGKVNNGGAVSNWETGRNIPSRDQYQKMCAAFIATGKVRWMPAYEDVVRAFNVDPNAVFTDAWDHMNVRQYQGKHPAEKPQDLLQHIVSTSSYPGDVVLDCFSGSGATIAAALKLGRKALGIEIEEKWVQYSRTFISRQHADSVPTLKVAKGGKGRVPKEAAKSLPLFATGS